MALDKGLQVIWWKKRQPEVAVSPAPLDAAKANAWSRVVAHYAEVRQRHGLPWDRANHVDLQNFFLGRHEELKREFPREYGGLERSLVEEDFARFKTGAPPVAQPGSMLGSVSKSVLPYPCLPQDRIKDMERKGLSGI